MLFDTIKQKLLIARKAGEKATLSILTVVVGESETLQFSKGHAPTVTDEEVIKIIKKLIEDNSSMLAQKPELANENEILSELLPKMASKDEIRAALAGVDLGAKEGQARGIAIKHLKTEGIMAESKDVMEVVAEKFAG
jgi:uncharacterized protein YqeY